MDVRRRVLLADANEEFRALLRKAIDQTEAFTVAGVAGSAAETLELTEADILLPFSAEKGMGKEDLIRLLVQTCGG